MHQHISTTLLVFVHLLTCASNHLCFSAQYICASLRLHICKSRHLSISASLLNVTASVHLDVPTSFHAGILILQLCYASPHLHRSDNRSRHLSKNASKHMVVPSWHTYSATRAVQKERVTTERNPNLNTNKSKQTQCKGAEYLGYTCNGF